MIMNSGDKDKRLSIKEYLNMIRPYLSSIIDDHKHGWKIQLTMEISFVCVIKNSDKGSNESYITYMHSKNISVFIGHETN